MAISKDPPQATSGQSTEHASDSSSSMQNTSSSSIPSTTAPAQLGDTGATKPTQPSVEYLASLGIKVRDFAYESTLPPIAPIPRVPRQVLPGPKPLKRHRTDDENENDPTSGLVSDTRNGDRSKKSRSLERKATEPAPDSDRPYVPPVRRLAGQSANRVDWPGQSQVYASQLPTWGSSSMRPSQTVDESQGISQPPLQFDSQESEPYIDTPLVTPNGSLQWQSQTGALGTVRSSQIDDNSQLSSIYSRLGISPQSPTKGDAAAQGFLPIPGSVPPFRVLSPIPANELSVTTPDRTMQSDPSSPTASQDVQSQPPFSEPAFTRYYFRTRPVAPPYTPPRQHSNTRRTRSAAALRPEPYPTRSARSMPKRRGDKRSTLQKNHPGGLDESVFT